MYGRAVGICPAWLASANILIFAAGTSMSMPAELLSILSPRALGVHSTAEALDILPADCAERHLVGGKLILAGHKRHNVAGSC